MKVLKPDQHKQIEFIKDCLRKGEQRAAILEKFGKVWKSVGRATFDSRLKIANEAIRAEFSKINTKAEESIKEEVEARKLKIMTVAERINLLVKIAYGEEERDEVFFDKGQPKKVKVKPNFNDRLKAISEINKMGGDYAPQKTDITSGGNEIRVFTLSKSSARTD